MKTWSELQEWVELQSQSHVNYMATRVRFRTLTAIQQEIDTIFERQWFKDLDHDEEFAVRAAFGWKIMTDIAKQFHELGEGWCEAYYRDLKRMYEEES